MNAQDARELKSLGDKLKALRLQKDISQEKFAELTGLDRTYISGLERGLRNPSFLIIKKLADALDITPNVLF
ncbi:MAG: helix-turn-helix domain-containing protein [Treponema sp.]